MKNSFKKTWFKIVFFGLILGTGLILIDSYTNVFKKAGSTKFKGPVEMDKADVYITKTQCEEPGYDFGKVKEGDSLKHIFQVKNTGNAPLFIYKAVVTCDCVATSFSTDPVAPGATAEVAVFFRTTGRKGPQTRTVELHTNTDPVEQALIITADVQ